MNSHEDLLDVSELCFDGDFDSQLANVLQHVRLTRSEVENLRYLFDDLEQTLQCIWPGCEVQPFGSIVTGLGIRTSDVDCFVQLHEGINTRVQTVISARNILRRYPRIFAELFAITHAKVPIVKFLHIPTGRHCDVNFKSPAGVRNSKLIAFLLSLDKRALQLAIIVKYWSKVHKFTGTNLMPNYALTLLVIFYLQQKGIVPPVSQLQKNIPIYMVDDWDTGFEGAICLATKNTDSMYDTMGGFFKYYSGFDFNTYIVSPFLGSPIKRSLFENVSTVPAEFTNYTHNLSNELCKVLRLDSKLCIQDPFEHSRNCAVAVYPKLFEKVLSHFHYAKHRYEEHSGCFLKSILSQTSTIPVTISTNKPKHVFQNKVNKPQNDKYKGKLRNCYNNWFEDFNRLKKRKR